MYDHCKSYRFTADGNAVLRAQTKIHRIELVNGATTATAAIAIHDFATVFTLVAAQTQADYDNSPTTEGTFVAGSGYAATDTITLSDGSLITVDTVTAGAVATFTVTTVGTGSAGPLTNVALTQSSSSGAGTGFTLTPDTGNLTNASDPVAELRCNEVTDTTAAEFEGDAQSDFPRPLFFEVAVSVNITGASAVGYIYYTL